MDLGVGAQAILGVALLAYAPGRAWVGILLPGLRGAIERFVFSVGLSVAIVALLVTLGDIAFNVPVRPATVVAWALSATLAGLAPRLYARLDAVVTGVLSPPDSRSDA